jgi:hypothetical protein
MSSQCLTWLQYRPTFSCRMRAVPRTSGATPRSCARRSEGRGRQGLCESLRGKQGGEGGGASAKKLAIGACKRAAPRPLPWACPRRRRRRRCCRRRRRRRCCCCCCTAFSPCAATGGAREGGRMRVPGPCGILWLLPPWLHSGVTHSSGPGPTWQARAKDGSPRRSRERCRARCSSRVSAAWPLRRRVGAGAGAGAGRRAGTWAACGWVQVAGMPGGPWAVQADHTTHLTGALRQPLPAGASRARPWSSPGVWSHLAASAASVACRSESSSMLARVSGTSDVRAPAAAPPLPSGTARGFSGGLIRGWRQ